MHVFSFSSAANLVLLVVVVVVPGYTGNPFNPDSCTSQRSILILVSLWKWHLLSRDPSWVVIHISIIISEPPCIPWKLVKQKSTCYTSVADSHGNTQNCHLRAEQGIDWHLLMSQPDSPMITLSKYHFPFSQCIASLKFSLRSLLKR